MFTFNLCPGLANITVWSEPACTLVALTYSQEWKILFFFNQVRPLLHIAWLCWLAVVVQGFGGGCFPTLLGDARDGTSEPPACKTCVVPLNYNLPPNHAWCVGWLMWDGCSICHMHMQGFWEVGVRSDCHREEPEKAQKKSQWEDGSGGQLEKPNQAHTWPPEEQSPVTTQFGTQDWKRAYLLFPLSWNFENMVVKTLPLLVWIPNLPVSWLPSPTVSLSQVLPSWIMWFHAIQDGST